MSDEKYMNIALNLAKETIGQTSPNPVVGAVVVKNGELVGFGAHLKAGGKHAEVHALDMAGSQAKGATLFVTLEPCSHGGRTPPCTGLIIKRGIKRVVMAVEDPNKQVDGIKKLQEAGIDVTQGVLEEEARALNAPFFHYIQTGRPYVTLKTATSLDGKIATKTGESQWITGEEARTDAHIYRQTHDAILVGVNTVLADNPSLTARLSKGNAKQPIRIILDTHLRTPLDAKVVTDGETDTWIFTGRDVTEKKKQLYVKHKQVTLISLKTKDILIQDVLQELGKRNIMSLFVEGGAAVNGSFLKGKTFNQLIVYMAPMLIGGGDAPTSFLGQGFANLADAPTLTIKQFEQIGKDLKIVATYKEERAHVYRNC